MCVWRYNVTVSLCACGEMLVRFVVFVMALGVACAFSSFGRQSILAKRMFLHHRAGLNMKATASGGVYADYRGALKQKRASYRVPVLAGLEPSHNGRINSGDFANRRYILREEMDGEYFSSIVELEENGEVNFLESSRENAKKITGAWSVENSIIHLAVSRTHASRFAEYTVDTQFLGRVEEAPNSNPVMGEISIERCDDDDRSNTGIFSLVSISNGSDANNESSRVLAEI